MAKRSQSSSVSIWSAGHQFQSDRQQFSLQVKLTKYKWKVTGDTKAPTEMDASCGKIIATTKKVIRVTAYMHIRVSKLDVSMSSFQNLVKAKPETQKHLRKWNETWKIPNAMPKQDWKYFQSQRPCYEWQNDNLVSAWWVHDNCFMTDWHLQDDVLTSCHGLIQQYL